MTEQEKWEHWNRFINGMVGRLEAARSGASEDVQAAIREEWGAEPVSWATAAAVNRLCWQMQNRWRKERGAA